MSRIEFVQYTRVERLGASNLVRIRKDHRAASQNTPRLGADLNAR